MAKLVNKLVEAWSQMASVKDDLYLVSADGKAFVGYGHHIPEDGVPIFFNDIEKAGIAISALNSMGAEFEVFSNDGPANASKWGRTKLSN